MLTALRRAVRRLVRQPAFAIPVVGTIALGIGLSTAVVALLYGFLIRPQPGIIEPDKLVRVSLIDRRGRERAMSGAQIAALRSEASPFQDVTQFEARILFVGGDIGQRLATHFIAGRYFETLGVRPVIGRIPTPDEIQGYASPNVALLSERIWRERYAADPNVLGRSLTVADQSAVIVIGVLPAHFQGPEAAPGADVWMPAVISRRSHASSAVIARLRENTPDAVAQQRGMSILSSVDAGDERGTSAVTVRPLRGGLAPEQELLFFRLAGTVSALVIALLIVTCANVAGLLLSRALARQQELAVRSALGATRLTLAIELFAEALVLFLAGGALGACLTSTFGHGLLYLLRPPSRIDVNFALDARLALAFAAIVFVAAVASGLGPAFRASRLDIVARLRIANDGGAKSTRRLQSIFVIVQLAFGFAAATMAAHVAFALRSELAVDPGIPNRNSLVVASVVDALVGRESAQQRTVLTTARQSLRQSGIGEGAVASAMPGTASQPWRAGVRVASGADQVRVDVNVVTPEFFRVLGLIPNRGALPGGADRGSVVISMAAASFLFPGTDAVGRTLSVGNDSARLTVAAVVPNVRYDPSSAVTRPVVYLPDGAAGVEPANRVLVVASGNARAARDRVSAALKNVDAELPVLSAVTLDESMRQRLAGRQTIVDGLMGLAAIMIVLAVAGTLSMVAYAAHRRKREMGIRRALGAQSTEVVMLLLRRAAIVAAVGSVVGAALAVPGIRITSSTTAVPLAATIVIFAAGALLLIVTALLASLPPALSVLSSDLRSLYKDE